MMKINNISFVVIARNEEFSITRVLKSLAVSEFECCQFVLVDSASSDNTLEEMNRFSSERSACSVISCSGILNAAIVRNIGLKYVTNEFVFFVDGDTAVLSGFVIDALEEFSNDAQCIGVTGQLAENIYSYNYIEVIKSVEDRFNINQKMFVLQTGGNVILRKAALLDYGAWDERFNINEDFELTLRLSQYGSILALPVKMGTHHTLEYKDRIISQAFKGYSRYIGYLLRMNISNLGALKAIVNKEIGTFIGCVFYFIFFALTVSVLFFERDFPFIGAGVFCILLFVDLANGVRKGKNMSQRMVNRLINPIPAMIGFICLPWMRGGINSNESTHHKIQ